MMQRAAFILHIADAMPVVAVTAGRTVVVGARERRLAFEHVHGWSNITGTMPASWAIKNSPSSHGPNRRIVRSEATQVPLDLECRSTLAPPVAHRNPRDAFCSAMLHLSHRKRGSPRRHIAA